MRADAVFYGPDTTLGDACKKLGSYELLSQFAHGGMATLYLARRSGPAGFSRRVVVKVVHPHLASDKLFVDMFIDEAKLAARIHHPNVLHVEELGEDNGTYFIVTEHVDGVSLADWLAGLGAVGQRLPVPIAVHLAMEIAEGLHAAHDALDEEGRSLNIVHRDVSPQNVLVSRQGRVKLIDFGIAKARDRSQHTATGTVRGKIRYMAPEQALSQAVDRRTDVYALGIVLWEMLVGEPLFDADSMVTLVDRVRCPKVEPPSTIAGSAVSHELDAIVMSALAVAPENRPATAQELREQLLRACPEVRAIGAQEVRILLGAMPGLEQRATPAYARQGEQSETRPVTAPRGDVALTTPAHLPCAPGTTPTVVRPPGAWTDRTPRLAALPRLAEPPLAPDARRNRGFGIALAASIALASVGVLLAFLTDDPAGAGRVPSTASATVRRAPAPSEAHPEAPPSVRDDLPRDVVDQPGRTTPVVGKAVDASSSAAREEGANRPGVRSPAEPRPPPAHRAARHGHAREAWAATRPRGPTRGQEPARTSGGLPFVTDLPAPER